MKDQPGRISAVARFIEQDIWRMRANDLPRTRRFLLRYARVLIVAVKEFIADKCPLRASALTFYSLLSIVPVAAMAFAVAKGFGFQKRLEQQLLENFSGHEEVIMRVIDFSRNMLENTKGGIIAGVGVAVLLWAVISVLGHIETSLNDIWGIKKARSIGRKFSDYLSIMLIAPVLLMISSSATVMIATHLAEITEKIAFLGVFSPLISVVISALPYGLAWLLFAFIYIFMPHGKVNYSSGIVAGIAAGTIFVIVQNLYIFFQVGVAKYNAIYGSFAALPLFLVWLQLSWLIVLFGAELSCAHQNADTYEFEPDIKNISPLYRKLLSLQVAHLLVAQVKEGKNPITLPDISRALDMPIRLAQEIVSGLAAAGLATPVASGDETETAYQPARDINDMSVAFIIDAMDNTGTDAIPVGKTDSLEALSEAMKAIGDAMEKSPGNKQLKEI